MSTTFVERVQLTSGLIPKPFYGGRGELTCTCGTSWYMAKVEMYLFSLVHVLESYTTSHFHNEMIIGVHIHASD